MSQLCPLPSVSAASTTCRAKSSARAPFDDIVLEGEDVDLTRLPIPMQFSVDGAPYITAGQISARDPVTGIDTTGFHRLMLKGKNRLGVSLHSRRRMFEFHRRAEERGQPLPAAITLGIHPLHYMGSMAYAYPPGVRNIRNHRRPVRRILPARPLWHVRARGAGGGRDRHRRRDPGRGCANPRARSASSPATPPSAARRTSSSRTGCACAATRCSTASSRACRATTSWCRASPARARS